MASKDYPLLSYCVAGHHGGLPDGGSQADDGSTLLGRLHKADAGKIPDYSAYSEEVEVARPRPPRLCSIPGDKAGRLFTFSFLSRMVFSCLVDADFLCTEAFMRGASREALRCESPETLRSKLETALARYYPPTSKLNEARCGLLDDCLRTSRESQGVFSLTAPTGSGKTLALMRFALNHIGAHNDCLRRVIVAEPYTSIIEQNAEVYRSILGRENVLEHQANFDFDARDDQDEGLGSRLRLATENWDVPVVISTNVQLFESLYSNKTSRCRRLHNIAGSVIVLDEAQMIPTKYLIPCIKVLAELVRNYHCSVVLCSATQPALSKRFADEGLPVKEIVSDVDGLFTALSRVSYDRIGPLSDEELASRLVQEESVLCITNSRKQTRELYELVKEREPNNSSVYHLSTLMHPHHRMAVLAEIVRKMKDGHEPCTVISTSLVEAGVDLDFPCVYRAFAGIDSMVQAAGRCNREGKRLPAESKVYLYEPEAAYAIPPEVSSRAAVSRVVLDSIGMDDAGDIGAPSCVNSYFSNLYYLSGDGALDKKAVVRRLSDYGLIGGIPSIPFKTVGEDFRLIDEGSYSVIVPSPVAKGAIERLRIGLANRSDLRLISAYTVTLYEADLKNLLQAGAIEAVGDDAYLLVEESRYRPDTGLNVTVKGGEGLFW